MRSIPPCGKDDAVLFHYTGKENVPSITKNGLLPHFSEYLDEDPEGVFTEKDYMTTWMNEPVVWAGKKELIFTTLGAGDDPENIVLGIKQPCASRFKETDYKDWFSVDVVPPDCLCTVADPGPVSSPRREIRR